MAPVPSSIFRSAFRASLRRRRRLLSRCFYTKKSANQRVLKCTKWTTQNPPFLLTLTTGPRCSCRSIAPARDFVKKFWGRYELNLVIVCRRRVRPVSAAMSMGFHASSFLYVEGVKLAHRRAGRLWCLMETRFYETPAEFRAWLSANHETATEIGVVFHKKASGRPSMTWTDAVDQALCFGWIDSVARRIDETSRVQRFTPRKPRSNWSAVNIKKAWEFFGKQPPSYRQTAIYWVMNAKRDETRSKRLARLIEVSADGRRLL